jgi:hypothetical protein
MRTLFTEDFQKEEARFSAAIPTTDRGTAPSPTVGGGTRELGSRKS